MSDHPISKGVVVGGEREGLGNLLRKESENRQDYTLQRGNKEEGMRYRLQTCKQQNRDPSSCSLPHLRILNHYSVKLYHRNLSRLTLVNSLEQGQPFCPMFGQHLSQQGPRLQLMLSPLQHLPTFKSTATIAFSHFHLIALIHHVLSATLE